MALSSGHVGWHADGVHYEYEVELQGGAENLRRYREQVEGCRESLADLIREAAADGMRQVDIVKATGYTREQVRRIVAGRTR